MAGKALEGIRVIDLGMFWAGPYCGGMLADLGAEVIKVESSSRPDPLRIQGRGMYPSGIAGEKSWNRVAMINERNRNKYGITLDLNTPKGKDVFKRLVKISDVLSENFSRRVMPALGLDYSILKEINPRLIMISLASQGLTGPEKDYVSFGNTLEQIGGLAHITGYPGEVFTASFAYPDATAGVFGSGTVIAALYYREKTGLGMHIDLSQRELATCTVGEVLIDYSMNGRTHQPIGNRHPTYAPYGCYPCAGNDEWVTIAVTSDDEWQKLCQVMGKPSLADDTRFADIVSRWKNQDELDKIITEWTKQRGHYEAMNTLQANGVAAGAVLSIKEIFADPHVKERGYLLEVTHPDAGTHLYRDRPIKLSKTPLRNDMPAPGLGQHNHYVYGQLLGMSQQEINEMEKEGIIGTVPNAKDLQFT